MAEHCGGILPPPEPAELCIITGGKHHQTFCAIDLRAPNLTLNRSRKKTGSIVSLIPGKSWARPTWRVAKPPACTSRSDVRSLSTNSSHHEKRRPVCWGALSSQGKLIANQSPPNCVRVSCETAPRATVRRYAPGAIRWKPGRSGCPRHPARGCPDFSSRNRPASSCRRTRSSGR